MSGNPTPAPLRNGCPTCGGFKMLLSNNSRAFVCTDDWHVVKCHCGRPATHYVHGIPTCGDDR